jgi:hypothetical protein
MHFWFHLLLQVQCHIHQQCNLVTYYANERKCTALIVKCDQDSLVWLSPRDSQGYIVTVTCKFVSFFSTVGNIYKILEFKSNQFVLSFYSCTAMILQVLQSVQHSICRVCLLIYKDFMSLLGFQRNAIFQKPVNELLYPSVCPMIQLQYCCFGN